MLARRAGTEPTGRAGARVGRIRCWRVGLVVMIVFAGYLLFAHGCHGSEEEDDLVLWNPPPQGRGTSIATGLGRNKLDWLVCSRSWIACDT